MPVVVVGSANQDYLVTVQDIPTPGETVLASTLVKQPGGKGANQAVAAVRAGAETTFIGCVGDDDDGLSILSRLRSEGVDVAEVEVLDGVSSGLALVQVMENGDNAIVVVPGANAQLSGQRVAEVIGRLTGPGCAMVVQAEVTAEVVAAAIRSAHRAGARPILNLAPYRRTDPDVLSLCDPLVMNGVEASALLGRDIHGLESALDAADDLLGLCRSAVVTLGAHGAVWVSADGAGACEAPPVEAVVDTTGAGDAFVGVLATFLAEGATLERAVSLGVRAGSFSVERLGAQSSYPMRDDIVVMPDRRRSAS
jgi:ribokinase